ncbi:gluconokinase [Brevibacterium sp.]|uniref:gluconokinase n=1 Tax=Brevibacterium sp. TaxID=1701 RepID=UPI0028122538|nr:gluconokinase [Brevibacterium sp.]
MDEGTSHPFTPSTPLIIMGVSGTGKTSVGRLLAAELGIDFLDGDDLHSPANKAKMQGGVPLDDDDRWPWLQAVALRLSCQTPPIIACSALKRSYRDFLRARVPLAFFIHLTGPREKIVEHLALRSHEFMSPTLVDSQLNTLEPLGADEPHLRAPIDVPPEAVCRFVMDRLPSALDRHRRALGADGAGTSARTPNPRPLAEH